MGYIATWVYNCKITTLLYHGKNQQYPSLVVFCGLCHRRCDSSGGADGCFTSPRFFYTELSFKALVS
jgi:hypothetical protein